MHHLQAIIWSEGDIWALFRRSNGQVLIVNGEINSGKYFTFEGGRFSKKIVSER